MTAELAPNEGHGPAHARDFDPRPIDVLRERELTRRIEAGQNEIDAWAAVATDERIGLVSWRGKPSLPVQAAVRSYARFLRRMAPWAVADAKNRAERAMARTAPRNAATIQDIADGKFPATTGLEVDVARTRLAGAKEALKIVGIGADKQTRIMSTAVQVNVSGSLLSKLGD